jgi:hypothetical protein
MLYFITEADPVKGNTGPFLQFICFWSRFFNVLNIVSIIKRKTAGTIVPSVSTGKFPEMHFF